MEVVVVDLMLLHCETIDQTEQKPAAYPTLLFAPSDLHSLFHQLHLLFIQIDGY
jgi:hypothetical protein